MFVCLLLCCVVFVCISLLGRVPVVCSACLACSFARLIACFLACVFVFLFVCSFDCLLVCLFVLLFA